MDSYTIRLLPDQGLLERIEEFAGEHQIQAGYIATCVGSLTRAALRFADQDTPEILEGPFEILSLVGTFSNAGSHLHLSIADREGKVLGGHLAAGCRVYTTAEIIFHNFPDLIFRRELCQRSGFLELVVDQI